MKLKTNNILIGLTLTIGITLPYVGVVGEVIEIQEEVATIEENLQELQLQNVQLTNNNKNLENEISELEDLVDKAIKLVEEEKKAREAEQAKRAEEAKKAQEAKARSMSAQAPVSESQGNKQYVNIVATFYSALGEENGGYAGINALGGKLKQGSLAVPKDIPLGSKFYIEGYGNFVADDRGGAIKRIDSKTIKVDIFVPRKSGESDDAYEKRVNDMGRIKTKGWYIIP